MNSKEIEIIITALDTEIEHKDFEENDLRARLILNNYEQALQPKDIEEHCIKSTNDFKLYLNSIINDIDSKIHNELWNRLMDVIVANIQSVKHLRSEEDEINRLTNFNDELFELAYNNCKGLAHDELYEVVDKYEKPTIK